jgi:exonuclease III
MRKEEMLNLTLPGYKLASYFCREHYTKGGVCILVRNDLNCKVIELNNICKEKVFEISAVRLDTCSTSMIICCVYRSPSEKSIHFLNLLEKTLNLLYQPTTLMIICGDLNIKSLTENAEKQNLEIIMNMFNLTQVVTFPTRICNNKGTLIDNIFLDKTKLNNLTVHALDNGLSDYTAQILTLVNLKVPISKHTQERLE